MNQHTKAFESSRSEPGCFESRNGRVGGTGTRNTDVDPKSIEAWDVIASIAVQKENYEEAEMAYRCVDSHSRSTTNG